MAYQFLSLTLEIKVQHNKHFVALKSFQCKSSSLIKAQMMNYIKKEIINLYVCSQCLQRNVTLNFNYHLGQHGARWFMLFYATRHLEMGFLCLFKKLL